MCYFFVELHIGNYVWDVTNLIEGYKVSPLTTLTLELLVVFLLYSIVLL